MRNPEFESWCGGRGGDLQACSRTVLEYWGDLFAFLSVHDPRSIPVLQAALNARSSVFVERAAGELVRLLGIRVLPIIEKTCERLSAKRSEDIIVQAANYIRGDEMNRLVERFVHDPLAKEWARKRAATHPATGR